MSDFIRNTTLGVMIRFVTRNTHLQYPEERRDFELPESYVKAVEAAQQRFPAARDASPDCASLKTSASTEPTLDPAMQERKIVQLEVPDVINHQTQPTLLADGTILVDWYNPTDPANPQNWTSRKKALVSAIILCYTLAVYVGSAMCTPGYRQVMERFGVSRQLVSLTLSMYVLAYGIGPMLWSPLSEIPSIGRNPPYIFTFAIFVILTIPTALADNFAGLVVLRFLLGFFGSPCLATGPATLGDLYPLVKLPYALSLWAFAATSGPAIAPLISGFSVPAEGWRWAYWEMLWLSGPILIAMLLLLPETSSATILLRRAQRLRALTGNPSFKSQSEIDQSTLQIRDVVIESLWRPMQMMLLDPSIAFAALYSALIYGIFYSFFECFPLVYIGMHRFNLGEEGIVFLSVNVGAAIAIVMYWSYIYRVFEPAVRAHTLGPPERLLRPALPASFLFPIGLFIFAWTSSPEIPWIAPTIGIAVVLTGIFIVLQCIFLYLPLSYPRYAASLFAGNDLARSSLAAATIHFSQPLYDNLGVSRGVTLLAGLTVGCIAGIFALWHYGDRLRARSRFAQK